MSAIVHFRTQAQFLTSHLPEAVLEELGLRALNFLTKQDLSLDLTRSQLQHIAFSTIYAMARHRRWLRTPIVEEVMRDFLVSEHRLPNSTASALVEEMLDYFLTYLDQDDYVRSNQDFVRFLFVKSSCSSSEAQLLAELGLGPTILKRIRLVAEQVFSQTHEASNYEFQNEIDQLITDTVIGMAHDLKVCPWAIDLYRLKYLLPAKWAEAALDDLQSYFDLLIKLSEHKGITVKLLNKDQDGLNGSRLKDALDDLLAAGMVFCESNHQSFDRRIWRATALCHEVTAACFAARRSITIQDDLNLIKELPAKYQIALSSKMTTSSLLAWFNLLQQDNTAVHPDALTMVLKRVAKKTSTDHVLETLLNLLTKSNPYWYRRAICLAIANIANPEQARQVLTEVAANDPSLQVQNTVLKATRQIA